MQMDGDLIKKYLEGKCTEAESEKVKQWLDDTDTADTWPHQIPTEQVTEDIAAIWDRLEGQMNVEPGKSREKIDKNWFAYGSVAACLLVVVVMLFYLYHGKSSKLQAVETIAIHWQKVRNMQKDSMLFQVSDGSLLVLYRGAEIEFPDRILNNQRRLRMMSGKVCFNIRHDPSSPCSIEIGKNRIEVLGTVFTIHKTKRSEVIALQDGRISYRVENQKEYVLQPGQEVHYNLYNGVAQVLQTRVPENDLLRTRYKNSSLQFKDVSMGTVFKKLEDRFDVHLVCRDKDILQLHYTGDLTGKSLENIQQILTLTADLQFRGKGIFIYISHKKANDDITEDK